MAYDFDLMRKVSGKVAVVGIGEASVDEIELVNIRQATHFAMARAVRALETAGLIRVSRPARARRMDHTMTDSSGNPQHTVQTSHTVQIPPDVPMVALLGPRADETT